MLGKVRHVACFLTLLALAPSVAEARVQTEAGYTKLQAFNGALRFIRIDQGFAVTEKDLESGYLLFEYKGAADDKPTSGSVEVIEKDGGVSVVIQLPQMPEHHERYLADGLLAKLRSDYGDPPARKPPSDAKAKEREKPAPDGSAPTKGREGRREGDRDKKAPPATDERVPGYRIQ